MSTRLTYPASTAYKQWVWKEIRKKSWTLQKLVDEMNRKDRTLGLKSTSAVSQLIGAEGSAPPPSNTHLMPAMNAALGIEPPPVCDPTDEIAQIRDRFTSRWKQLTEREKRIIRDLLSDES